MNFKKIFKIEYIKKILLKKVSKFFQIFKRLKFEDLKRKKYFYLFLILIFLTSFLLWKNFNDKKIEEIEKKNNEIVAEQLEIRLRNEELKREEIEKRSYEETIYGELGDFWIEIDTNDLQVKAPIVEGVSGLDKNKDNKILDEGVGHHTTTAFPNRKKGNVVLSGHRWFPGDIPARTVFIDLDKLKINDRVRLFYENEEFIYRITGSKVIQDTEVGILEQTEKATITIYTCTPKYPLVTPTKRLVYFGELVE